MKEEKSKTANIKDVAALADTSVATVSRYLNGDFGRMSPKTAQKVQEAIDKLNYVPNSVARQMKTKSSRMIAVVVSNIDDYFSTELFKGISSFLESKGYIGMLFDVDADIEREERLLKAIGEQSFDGLILQPFSDPQKIRDLIRRDIPIVIVDREMDPNPWPQVVTDNYEAARQATQYYSDKGFTHVIVMSSEIEAARTREERYKGIKSVGNKVDVVEVPEKSYNHAEIDKKLLKLIQNSDEKTLIFFLKERWLLEFMPSLLIEGVVDNKTVTATGFADTDIARQLEPKLTLISQDPYLMGASAAEVMYDIVSDKEVPDDRIVIEAKLE